MNDVEFVGQKTDQFAESLKQLEQRFVGRDAIFKVGKFKGRRGRCTMITIQRQQPAFLVQPYRLSGSGDELLWDDPQARTYLPIDYLEFVEK